MKWTRRISLAINRLVCSKLAVSLLGKDCKHDAKAVHESEEANDESVSMNYGETKAFAVFPLGQYKCEIFDSMLYRVSSPKSHVTSIASILHEITAFIAFYNNAVVIPLFHSNH